MRFFIRNSTSKVNDKAAAIKRAVFDADRGCVELALARLADVRMEFPNDIDVENTEGMLRKDFLGQGLQAQQHFLRAQEIDSNDVFSATNSARCARNLEEYQRQSKRVRSLVPKKDLQFFDYIDKDLSDGLGYCEILCAVIHSLATNKVHGECASFIEIALQVDDLGLTDELALRDQRARHLRELDKLEEMARQARFEDYPPHERLALAEALKELDQAIKLNPQDPKLWNYKSAWLLQMWHYDECYAAGQQALAIQPSGYLNPLVNMAWADYHRGRIEEAKALSEKTIQLAPQVGSDADFAATVARSIIDRCNEPKPSNDETLTHLAQAHCDAANRVANQFKTFRKWKELRFGLVPALLRRCRPYRDDWHDDYIKMTAELLHDFCPELILQEFKKLATKSPSKVDHHLYAALYIAAQSEGVMERDACRLIALVILSSQHPGHIRNCYRQWVLGPAAVDARFAPLVPRMRAEFERLSSDYPMLIADQPPLQIAEFVHAEQVTLSRFRTGSTVNDSLSDHLSQPMKGTEAPAASSRCSSGKTIGQSSAWLIVLGFILLSGGIGWAMGGPLTAKKGALIGLAVACMYMLIRRMCRTFQCAQCGRLLHADSSRSALMGVPSTVMYTGALNKGCEGVGCRCQQCGRIVCSSCDQHAPCACGSRDFRQSLLIYR